MKHKYHINIFYSAEDKAFVADVPDLRCCSALGATPEEALREVQVAIEAWLASAKANRRKLPKPTYRPVIYQAAS